MVRQAELHELRQADVILATCSVAAKSRMAQATNIKQVRSRQVILCLRKRLWDCSISVSLFVCGCKVHFERNEWISSILFESCKFLISAGVGKA